MNTQISSYPVVGIDPYISIDPDLLRRSVELKRKFNTTILWRTPLYEGKGSIYFLNRTDVKSLKAFGFNIGTKKKFDCLIVDLKRLGKQIEQALLEVHMQRKSLEKIKALVNRLEEKLDLVLNNREKCRFFDCVLLLDKTLHPEWTIDNFIKAYENKIYTPKETFEMLAFVPIRTAEDLLRLQFLKKLERNPRGYGYRDSIAPRSFMSRIKYFYVKKCLYLDSPEIPSSETSSGW